MTPTLPAPGTPLPSLADMLAAIGWRQINITRDAIAAEDIRGGALRISDRWGPDWKPRGVYACRARRPDGEWATFAEAVEAAYRYHVLNDRSVELPAPGTPLREFTVEMLEALPTGADFLDTNDSPTAGDGLGQWFHAITKGHDGTFSYCGEKQTVSRLLEWTPAFDYRLIDPETKTLPEEEDDPLTDTDEKAEALAPFAAFAALIPDDCDDDEIVVGELMGAPLRVRDFRVAGRVLK